MAASKDSQSQDCSVCCEPYTDVKRLRVTCAYCQYDACQACYRKYILDTMQDAHCMGCRQAWSRDFLMGFFPPSWLNSEYKKHRETILIEREKQLLPESQILVANYQESRELRVSVAAKALELRDYKLRAGQLTREIWNDRYRADRLEANGYRGAFGARGDEPAKKARNEFIAPCRVDGCRGFMGATLECGVCKAKACTDCGVLLGEEDHECVPDEVASFKAIKKQTRPCPNCAIPTFKISGCSQMWCTGCQHAWDWNSGELVRGVIHNPHYFEFARARANGADIPRQPGDGGPGPGANCDRQQFPQGMEVERVLRREIKDVFDYPVTEEIRRSQEYMDHVLMGNMVTTIQRRVIHISEVELPHLRNRYRRTDNADLRLKYLVKDLSDEQLRTQLQRREKKRDKDVAVRDIYQMVRDTTRDALWSFVDGIQKTKACLEELEAIRKYANDNLRRVEGQFKMTVKYI